VKGSVTVEVTVDENGNVSDARVVNGPEELRKGVLQSVLNWRFAKDEAKSKQKVSVAFQPPPPGAIEPPKDPEIDRVGADSQALIAGLTEQIEALDRVYRERSVDRTTTFLQQRLVEAEKQMELLQQQAPRNLENIYEAEVQLRDAQRRIETAREAQALAENRAAEAQAAQAEAQALRARREEALVRARAEMYQFGASVARFAGRTLKDIHIIPADTNRDLASLINLHAGDVLTAESIDAETKAAHDHDAVLEFVSTQDGQVELIVMPAPGRQ
jgi:hypothetical protein